jgi:hypothetical protein
MGGQVGSALLTPFLAPFFPDGPEFPTQIRSIKARSINAILNILITLSLRFVSRSNVGRGLRGSHFTGRASSAETSLPFVDVSGLHDFEAWNV